jgi:hypothetical protein
VVLSPINVDFSHHGNLKKIPVGASNQPLKMVVLRSDFGEVRNLNKVTENQRDSKIFDPLKNVFKSILN